MTKAPMTTAEPHSDVVILGGGSGGYACALRAAQLLATFAGVLGFALMFNSPARMALAAATVAFIPNVARIVLTDAGVPPAVATALAAFVVGLIAEPRGHPPVPA